MNVRKANFYTTAAAAIVALGLGTRVAQAAPTAEQVCQSGQNAAAGKYSACLAKAQKGLVSSGDAAKYAAAVVKCDEKFQAAWDKVVAAATAAGTTCPGSTDASAVGDYLNGCVAGLGDAVAGGPAPVEPLVCAVDLSVCTVDLGVCGDDLAACDGTPNGTPTLRTGQTTSYGAGSDGDLEAGTARSFTDHGDGTITDHATGLMWEKKDMSGGIHDVGNGYTFSDYFEGTGSLTMLNGTVVTTFLATLNSESFAGHNDWRLPNVNELRSLVNLETRTPATFTEFNTNCAASCTVLTCSCSLGYFLTSSTATDGEAAVWLVAFDEGSAHPFSKVVNFPARAVRDAS